MRESILRELYYGNISLWDRRRIHTPEYTALTDKIDNIVEHFKTLLSPEEYEKIMEMQDLQSQVNIMEELDLFESAFCTGTLLMIDIFGHQKK